eukprot:TRINITY_DN3169_c0_g1_i2.p2 TRINITY_DN3169_c0_g1~~TRINITY_DN3169_c0_g1_i2.p2  ORF type:complete len:131 (+),score=22.94 TRINITY_DN3169_c0_g1_i2:69-461(+)
MTNKDKFLKIASSSGHNYILKEILMDPVLQSKLENTKALEEVKLMNDFYDVMKENPLSAVYGKNYVFHANTLGAINHLLLNDDLFRAMDIKKRKEYIKLVEAVRDNGGEVHIFSLLLPSGQRTLLFFLCS